MDSTKRYRSACHSVFRPFSVDLATNPSLHVGFMLDAVESDAPSKPNMCSVLRRLERLERPLTPPPTELFAPSHHTDAGADPKPTVLPPGSFLRLSESIQCQIHPCIPSRA